MILRKCVNLTALNTSCVKIRQTLHCMKKVAKKLLTFFNSIYQLPVDYELLPNCWVKFRGFLRPFPQNLRN